jgi:hypothetical protein
VQVLLVMILPSSLPTAAEERLKRLGENKAQMVEYLRLKLYEEDWHGCADAAMDIRDIESEIKGIEFMRGLRSQPL